MAATLTVRGFTDPSLSPLHQQPSNMGERKSIFGSIRQTFSKKPESSSSNTFNQPQHPQAMNTSKRTRRPASKPHNDDSPPAYTAAPNSSVQPRTTNGPSATVADDEYAFLGDFDTIFLIDDSGSMAGSRWRQTQEALMTITPICTAHDKDGIDIYFLNQPDRDIHQHITSPAAVQHVFETVRPGGGTPTGRRLGNILEEYMEEYTKAPKTIKPINIICITDGVPSDDVESVLIKYAKKLDKLDAPAWQVGIQFFQVGNEPQATMHLKLLDDELAAISGNDDLRDMVDTVPFTNANGARLSADGILKVVLGAVHRRLDRKSKDLHR